LYLFTVNPLPLAHGVFRIPQWASPRTRSLLYYYKKLITYYIFLNILDFFGTFFGTFFEVPSWAIKKNSLSPNSWVLYEILVIPQRRTNNKMGSQLAG